MPMNDPMGYLPQQGGAPMSPQDTTALLIQLLAQGEAMGQAPGMMQMAQGQTPAPLSPIPDWLQDLDTEMWLQKEGRYRNRGPGYPGIPEPKPQG